MPTARALLAVAGVLTILTLIGPTYLAAQQTQPAKAGDPAFYRFAVRDNLHNARWRFEHEKQGRVVFLGGSITQMTGWRDLTCTFLEGRFPETRFDFVNAGISSTDSSLGCFRLETDALSRGRVDLLFVEFAVNDLHNKRTATERIRGMEGIVRHARRHNPDIDIIFLYNVDPVKMELINRGQPVPEIVSHEAVAKHYNITAINLAEEVTARIKAGEFDWKTFGGLHPAPFGHRIYARSIATLLTRLWGESGTSDTAPIRHVMPSKPLDKFNYQFGRYVDISRAKPGKGFRLDPCWTAREGATRDRFHKVPMLVAEEPGAELTVPFEGIGVGIVIVAGPDVGVIEYNIDDGPNRSVDPFTEWSSGLHLPWFIMLDAELANGPHKLTLRTTDRKNPESKGHALRIVRFCVNGLAN